jgi:hypothetical protein
VVFSEALTCDQRFGLVAGKEERALFAGTRAFSVDRYGVVLEMIGVGARLDTTETSLLTCTESLENILGMSPKRGVADRTETCIASEQ